MAGDLSSLKLEDFMTEMGKQQRILEGVKTGKALWNFDRGY